VRAVNRVQRFVRRRRTRGQAMLEVGLALPFLLALLAGSVQVGSIAYGMVSVDTAAREGGIVGQDSPKSSLDEVVANGGTYTCSSSVRTVETNPICIAAYSSAGLLDKTKMTVKITVKGSSLLSQYQPPPDVVRTNGNGNGNSNSCNGSQGWVTGTVSGLPSGVEATVTSSTGGSTVTSGGSYTLCPTPGTGTISATVTSGNCTYSGSSSTMTITKNPSSSQTVNITVTASCTTTTTTTSTSTGTTSTTSTSSTVAQTTTTVSSFSCSQSVTYPGYFSVTVSYPVNIFVPIVGNLFADSGKSYRTVTTTVDEEIAPCGVTNGS
jgi:TadE-like protein